MFLTRCQILEFSNLTGFSKGCFEKKMLETVAYTINTIHYEIKRPREVTHKNNGSF